MPYAFQTVDLRDEKYAIARRFLIRNPAIELPPALWAGPQEIVCGPVVAGRLRRETAGSDVHAPGIVPSRTASIPEIHEEVAGRIEPEVAMPNRPLTGALMCPRSVDEDRESQSSVIHLLTGRPRQRSLVTGPHG